MADFSQHFPNRPGCLLPRPRPRPALTRCRFGMVFRHGIRLARQNHSPSAGGGCLLHEAAAVAGITRQAVLKRVNSSPDFDQAVVADRFTCDPVSLCCDVTESDDQRLGCGWSCCRGGTVTRCDVRLLLLYLSSTCRAILDIRYSAL